MENRDGGSEDSWRVKNKNKTNVFVTLFHFQGRMSYITGFVFAKDHSYVANPRKRQGEVRSCAGGSDQRESRTFIGFVRLVSKHYNVSVSARHVHRI